MDSQNTTTIRNHIEDLFPGLKIKVDPISKGYFVRYFDGPSLMNFSKTLLGGKDKIDIINGIVDGFVDIDGARHCIRISREYTYKTLKPAFDEAKSDFKNHIKGCLILDTLGKPVHDDAPAQLTVKGRLSPKGALALSVKNIILEELNQKSF